MNHMTAYAVDLGQKRTNNEDNASVIRIGWLEDAPVSLAIVADGMGGYHAGEVASNLAIETVVRHITRNWHSFASQTGRSYGYWLTEAVKAANQRIRSSNREKDDNMGTTLVAALIIGSRAYIANIGDSRAYRITHDEMIQITTDHSLVQDLLTAGMITPEAAKTHTLRGCITQAVGLDEVVDVDLFMVDLNADDILLLCSDGLNNELKDKQIFELIQAAGSLQTACGNLIRAANDAGGRDNIAVVLTQLIAQKNSASILTETLEMTGV